MKFNQGVINVGTIVGDVDNEVSTSQHEEARSEKRSKRPIAVFICHSHKDAEVASSLSTLIQQAFGLRDTEIRCSSQFENSLPPASRIDAQLRADVTSARVLVAVVTESFYRSAYGVSELGARWGQRGLILPVLTCADTGLMRGPLASIVPAALYRKQGVEALVQAVATALDAEKPQPASYAHSAKALIARCSADG